MIGAARRKVSALRPAQRPPSPGWQTWVHAKGVICPPPIGEGTMVCPTMICRACWVKVVAIHPRANPTNLPGPCHRLGWHSVGKGLLPLAWSWSLMV